MRGTVFLAVQKIKFLNLGKADVDTHDLSSLESITLAILTNCPPY